MMNCDPGQVQQVLNSLPYPIGKDQLVQLARQNNVNEQVINVLDKLPNKTFNSPQELQSTISGMLGKFGGGMNF